MQVSLKMIAIICPLVFLAGLVDSIAGGGGLISLPSYMLIGLPVHFAYGTNKFTSSIGTFFSAGRFIKNRKINYRAALSSVCGALVGSFFGARAALALDDKYLQYCLIIMLPVIAVFVLTRRGFGENTKAVNMSNRKMVVLSILSGLLVGAYDGFFGPGTGTFLILIYTTILGFNLTVASGNAKIVNLSSNLAALATFFAGGTVLIAVGAPAALFGIMGNWIGSGLAVKKGARVIKPVFLGVIGLLFLKISLDLFK